ncbi:hypothetical protein B0H19DRAFT_1350068 [Mycena capillaripes]|nr:hypothetical protein B0H19DRAFT_1350068 [Mycena capillaripes]
MKAVKKSMEAWIDEEIVSSSRVSDLLVGRLEMDKETGKLVKKSLDFRHYLGVKRPEHRKALTKMVLSTHSLAVERRRWKKRGKKIVPCQWRLWRFCYIYVEDPAHAMFKCSQSELTEIRQSFLNKLDVELPGVVNNTQMNSNSSAGNIRALPPKFDPDTRIGDEWKCVSSHEYPTTNTVVTPTIVQNIICAGGDAIRAKIYGAVNTVYQIVIGFSKSYLTSDYLQSRRRHQQNLRLRETVVLELFEMKLPLDSGEVIWGDVHDVFKQCGTFQDAHEGVIELVKQHGSTHYLQSKRQKKQRGVQQRNATQVKKSPLEIQNRKPKNEKKDAATKEGNIKVAETSKPRKERVMQLASTYVSNSGKVEEGKGGGEREGRMRKRARRNEAKQSKTEQERRGSELEVMGA